MTDRAMSQAADPTAQQASGNAPLRCPVLREPVYPRPAPYKKHFFWRLLKGLHSWFGLLSDVDFQIPIGSVQFLGLNLFLVNDPATVKRLMVDEVEDFPKHPYTLWILEPLIGRAIFSVNGPEWARQRRLVDQAFQVAQLRRVLPQMQGAVEAMVARLDAEIAAASTLTQQPAVPVTIEIDEAMTLVTADVIVRTILSRPLEAAEAAGIFDAFARYQRRAGQALMLRFLRLPQDKLQAYLGRHARTIRGWIREAIDSRLLEPAQQPPNGLHNGDHNFESRGDHPEPPQDLLQALIDARDPDTGGRFSRDELLDQVCFLFLAGHETSASSLGMAVYLLSCYPEAQARLRAEVLELLSSQPGATEGTFAAASDRPLTFEDLRQLPYAAAVFNETLRLYPPVSFFIRESQRDGELVDRRCPMRSLVTLSPWVIQRQEGQWLQPHAFDPERFLSDSGASPAQNSQNRQLARDVWLPFGLGPRKCPGAAFALQEALLVLAELVRRYELLPADGPAPDLVGRLTLRSRNGIRLKLWRLPTVMTLSDNVIIDAHDHRSARH
ncbi:MAG: cytochrome P450 [Cyanobacteria bacterium M_surface_7_m2_040]|nr:cytochrome P450 [Cyanobacteria bacterium M_surface_7_m2_040]